MDTGFAAETMAAAWLQLDAQNYPFTRSVAGTLREHDVRVDFLAGVDLIVQGRRASAQ